MLERFPDLCHQAIGNLQTFPGLQLPPEFRELRLR